MKHFAKTKAEQILPNIIRTHNVIEKLKKAVSQVNEIAEKIRKDVESNIDQNDLKADIIIQKLFQIAKPHPIEEHILNKARLRVELGNPPSKKGLGDAIHWEYLLESVKEGENLVLILVTHLTRSNEL